MSSNFKITNPRLIRKNALIGVFDLEMPSGLKINGVMLLESNGKRWINFPSKEYTKNGEKKYSPLIEFVSAEVRDRFQTAVLPLAEKELLPVAEGAWR
jgi:DNA-binding cell septation regulator SpoVG